MKEKRDQPAWERKNKKQTNKPKKKKKKKGVQIKERMEFEELRAKLKKKKIGNF